TVPVAGGRGARCADAGARRGGARRRCNLLPLGREHDGHRSVRCDRPQAPQKREAVPRGRVAGPRSGRLSRGLGDQSSKTQKVFPSGSANMKYVPHSSFDVGEVIFTPFLRYSCSVFAASFVPNEIPVFPFSGFESGQRWMRTVEPRAATVTQWGNFVTTRRPSLSWYHFIALFSFLTTTAIVFRVNMAGGRRPRHIRFAVHGARGGRRPRHFAWRVS